MTYMHYLMFFLFNPDFIEDRRELVEVRKKAELGLLDVAVTPTSKCGKGQRRKIPNSKNVPSEDGNDEHVAEVMRYPWNLLMQILINIFKYAL